MSDLPEAGFRIGATGRRPAPGRVADTEPGPAGRVADTEPGFAGRVAAEERGGVSRPRLVTVAHGTRTPAGNQVAAEITAAAGKVLGIEAIASYVELCDPLFADVLAAPHTGNTVVVPLLLSTGYHVRVDLPAAVAASAAPDRIALGRPFGPDPLLAVAQAERLVEAGAVAGQPVVMVAAGSSDPAALDDLAAAAALLAESWGGPVRLATLTGHGPRPAEVVARGDAVSSYLLATGFFHRKLRDEVSTAGAGVIADVIGPHPRLVELVVERARGLLQAPVFVDGQLGPDAGRNP